MTKVSKFLSAGLLLLLAPWQAQAQSSLDSGDTAWILTSTALVLFMTLPGLALFYGGLVRTKNVLSVLMQCFAITCVATIVWVVVGYSLAFGDGGSMNPWIGGFSRAFLADMTRESMSGSTPETVFSMFQLTFAIITPALIVGGFAERMRFSAMLLFSVAWLLVVYLPITHWVWGGGWLAGRNGFTGFCRWYRGAYYRWCRSHCHSDGNRQSQRFSTYCDVAAQHDHDGNRRWHVMGRLVRL